MGVAEQIGHDHKGDLIYKFDKQNQIFTNEVWDDTDAIREEFTNQPQKYVFSVPSTAIIQDYFVPRYYWNTKIHEAKIKAEKMNMFLMPLGELLDKNIIVSYKRHGSPQSRYKGRGTIPYRRVADIMNWDIYKNLTNTLRYL